METPRWLVWFCGWAIGAAAVGCSFEQSVFFTPVNTPTRAMVARPPESVEVIQYSRPMRPLTEVGVIEVRPADDPVRVFNRLRLEAGRMGCDGLIMISDRVDRIGDGAIAAPPNRGMCVVYPVEAPAGAPAEVAASPPAQAPGSPGLRRVTINGFAFATAPRPVSGSIATACGRVTLSTTNTELMPGFAFRNVPSAGDANVELTFDQPPAELSLSVGWVQRGEYLAQFNIPPTSVSGTLVREGAVITTSRPYPADDGRGHLSWVGLSSPQVSFVLGGPPGTAIGIDGFDIACAATGPSDH